MMAMAALTDMARHYRLPLFTYAGCSDANQYDQQAALESALWILMSSVTGGNLVHDVGYINNGLTTSLEQLVVSNEVIGMVRHITQGFEINEETLALDLIDRVGPGGEYLTSQHTLQHFKQNWFPDLISRQPYEKWAEEGRKDMGMRANERIKEILASHVPAQIDKEVAYKLKEIVKLKDKQ